MKANVERIVWEWLTATGTSLYTLCGTRVWHSQHPDSGTWSNAQPAVVFFVTGAGNSTNGQTDDVTIDFRCYGGDRTNAAAQTVGRALYARLQAAGGATATGTIHRAFRQSQQNLTDPDTGWPFVLCRYNLIVE